MLVGKVADIVNNPYGVSWQNLVDSQRIMDITLDEFNTHPTAFICINIRETDLAGHAEDVARYAERLQVVDRNLARLVEAMQPDDCPVVMAITVTIRPLVTATIPAKWCQCWFISKG